MAESRQHPARARFVLLADYDLKGCAWQRWPCQGRRGSPAAVAAGAPRALRLQELQLPQPWQGAPGKAASCWAQLSSVYSACKSTTGMCPRQPLALVKQGDTVQGFSPGLFNGSVCLLEFSCVAARGKKWQSLRWKPWDTKQVLTPWFPEVGNCSTGSGFHPPGRKWSYLCWPQSCKVPFRGMKQPELCESADGVLALWDEVSRSLTLQGKNSPGFSRKWPGQE